MKEGERGREREKNHIPLETGNDELFSLQYKTIVRLPNRYH
jgi:hypothetical protein